MNAFRFLSSIAGITLAAGCAPEADTAPFEADPGLAALTPQLIWSPEIELGELTYFDVSGEGRLALLDRMASTVFLLQEGVDPVGFGSRGRGPGELAGGEGLAFVSDTLVAVLDRGNARVSVWNLTGSLVAELPASGVFAEGLGSVDGKLFLKERIIGESEAGPGLDVRVKVWEDLHVEPGPALDLRASRLAWGAVARSDTVSCGPCSMEPMPGGDLLLQVYGPPRDAYRFLRVSVGGRVVGSFGRAGLEVVQHSPASWARQEARTEERSRLMRAAIGLPAAPRRTGPPRGVFPYMSPTAYPFPLGIDGQGRVWVLRDTGPDEGARLDVFDPEGRYLGEVTVPDLYLTSIRVRGQWMAARGETSLGAPRVHLFRLP